MTSSLNGSFSAILPVKSRLPDASGAKHVRQVGPYPIRLAAFILMMTTLSALAASTERPEDFVRRVYARYRNDGPGVSMSRPSGAAFYTASLLDAFEKDTALPNGGGVTVEWDPICDCQSFMNLRVKNVTIGEKRATTMRVQVAFINNRYPDTVTLTLLQTPVGWRIADIGVENASYKDVGDTNVESLLALLHKEMRSP